MIVVDMPMPQNCEDCPMSYWIRSGEYEGMMMCNALEFRESMKLREPAEDITKNYLVDSRPDKRPEGCPIIKEVKV